MRYIIVMVLLSLGSLNAGNTSGFEFLRTDFSSRAAAMGGAFIAMRGDVEGIFHNPAGLAFTEDEQFGCNYVNYLLDIGGGHAAYSRRIPQFGQISLAVLYFDYGDFEETNEFAVKSGRTYSADDIALAVSYADHLEKDFSYGVSLKYVHSSIEQYTASALAFDFGLIYSAPFEDDLYIGLSLLNVGTALSAFVETKENLPLSIRLGFSKKLAHLPLVFNAGINDLNVHEDDLLKRIKKFSVGGEFTLSPMLRLRLGYDNDLHQGLETVSGSGFAGVSFGVGVLWNQFRFDLGFSSFGELGMVQRIGIHGTL